MSYFHDLLTTNNSNYQINGVTIPEPTEPPTITFNNISDGGRLADNIDYEGGLKGVKCNIKLVYKLINKEHFDLIFNLTQGRYLQGGSFFGTIKVPTYTPQGVQTFTGYFMSSFSNNCKLSTEMYEDILGSSYGYGGANYDELHENVEFSFVQK